MTDKTPGENASNLKQAVDNPPDRSDFSTLSAGSDTDALKSTVALDPNATLAPTATQEPLLRTPQPQLLGTSGASRSSAVNSRFTVLRPHAKGGLGLVSLATDLELPRTVALKEIQYQYADDGDSRARFVREAEITGRLEHPGIVPVYGFGVAADGRPYYAMRFIQGRSLKDAIDEFHRLPTNSADRSLRFRELLRCTIDVCNTIEYAHSQRVIHRDLKPANVMVGAYGETLVVDWGLAKSLDEAEFTPDATRQVRKRSDSADTMDGVALGTPQYMSPEQASGRLSQVGPQSDIYSLGATLYHLLVGSPAFVGPDLTKLLLEVISGAFAAPNVARPDVPAPLSSICLKAMALKPDERYASAKEIAVEIQRWLADEPVQAHGEGFAERWHRRMRRHRSWVMSIATMVPLLLLVVTSAAFFVNLERIEAIKQRDIAVIAKAKESKQLLLTQESERVARQQEQAAQSSAEAAGRALANLQLINGERAQADRDPSGAALWFHQALPLIEKYLPQFASSHRARLARLLGPLPRPVRIQVLPDELRQFSAVHSISPDGQYLILTGALYGAVGFQIAKGEIAWPALPHKELLPMIDFSDNGKWLIMAGTDSGVQVWDLETGMPFGGLVSPKGRISALRGVAQSPIALSANGNDLAVCTVLPDESMQVERFKIGDAPTSLKPLEMPDKVSALGFHPTENRLMVATQSNVHFFDSLTGDEVGDAIVQPDVFTAKYSPDGRTLITATHSGYAQLWDTASRLQRGNRLDHRGSVREVVFSPQSDSVLTLSADLSARLWDVETASAIGVPLDNGDRPLLARFRSDGKAIVTIGLEHSVRVWDATTGTLLAGPWYHASAPDARFLGDKLLIAVDGRCGLWDCNRSGRAGAVEIRHENQDANDLISAQFLSGQEKLAVIDQNHVWIVDPTAPEAILRTIVVDGPIKSHELSADGRVLAICLQSNVLQFWDLSDESQAPTTISTVDPVKHYRLNHTGNQVLIADETSTAHLWDLSAVPTQGVALPHQGLIRDSHFSPDGTKLVTGSDDKFLRLWDVKTGTLIRQPIRLRDKHQAMPVSNVRFHPDGLRVAAGSDSDDVIVWEPFAPTETTHRFRVSGAVAEVRFTRDGRLLGAAGYTGSVLVWDWKKSGEPIANLSTNFFSKMVFSQDSKLIATAAIGSVSLWETQDGRRVGPSWQLQTRSLDVDAKQNWLVTTGEQIVLWDIRPESRSPEDLNALIRLLSLRKINDRGAIVFLSTDELVADFLQIQKQYPEDLESNPGRKISLPNR